MVRRSVPRSGPRRQVRLPLPQEIEIVVEFLGAADVEVVAGTVIVFFRHVVRARRSPLMAGRILLGPTRPGRPLAGDAEDPRLEGRQLALQGRNAFLGCFRTYFP